jgi:hypothetical protein
LERNGGQSLSFKYLEHFQTFTYLESRRESWYKDGDLIEEWASRYPQLFDTNTLLEARNQRKEKKHFHEWLSAILIYETTGYLSLVEKYQYEKHEAKHRIFRNYAPPEVLECLRTWPDRTQAPDLFVYSRTTEDWFFAEVKGPGDRLRGSQSDLHRRISEITGKKIKLIRLKRITAFST